MNAVALLLKFLGNAHVLAEYHPFSHVDGLEHILDIFEGVPFGVTGDQLAQVFEVQPQPIILSTG